MPIKLKASNMTEMSTMPSLEKLHLLQKSLGGLSEINSINRLQELGLIGSAFKVNSLHEEAMKAAQLATAGLAATFRENDAMMATQLAAARLAVFQDNESIKAAHIAATKAAFDTSAFQGLFSHSDAMKAAQREVFGMNDAMKAAFDTSSFSGVFSHGEAIKAAQFATAGLSDAMKAAFNTTAFDSVGEVLRSMGQLSDSSLLKTISCVPDSLRKMIEVFSGSQHLHNLTATVGLSRQAYQDMIRAYGMDTLADSLSEFDWPDSITVNDDDSITVDESIIGSIEVRQAITQVADAVTRQHQKKVKEQLAELVEQSKKQLSPTLQAILIPLIFILLSAFLNPAIEFVVQQLLPDDTQAHKDVTKQTPPMESFRLVKRKVLAVRGNPSSKARALGQLHTDQVVVVIEERDGWTLVSWSDKDNGLSLQGWVLSKHLRELQ